MSMIFSRQPGQVFVFNGSAEPAQAFIRLDNSAPYDIFKSIVTRVAVSSSCNFQVRHSMGGNAFLYTFGDRVGRVLVTGLSFGSYCDEESDAGLGIERVVAYYNANRLSLRASPIFMTVGRNLTLRMYLGALEIDVEDPSQQIWRYQLTFLEVPTPLPKLIQGAPASASTGGSAAAAGANANTKTFTAASTSAAPLDAGGYAGSAIPPTRVSDSTDFPTDSGNQSQGPLLDSLNPFSLVSNA